MAAYTVDVELTLTGAIMQALAAVAGAQGLGAVSAAVAKVEAGFAGWTAVLVGGAGIAIGASVMGALVAIAGQADKTKDAIARLHLQNLPTVEFQANVSHAASLGTKLGVKPDVAQDVMNKLQSMVLDPVSARSMLEPTLRMGKILKSFGKGGVEQVYPIVRMLEETGLTDPGRKKDLDKVMERLGKVLVQSGGTINPQQIQLGAVYARSARYGITSPEALSEEHPFLTDIFPHYLQMAGKSGQGGGGAALMSGYTKTVQGILHKKSIAAMGEYDLLDQGGVKGEHLAAINPYEWTQQVLVPALKAKGLTDCSRKIQKSSKPSPRFSVPGWPPIRLSNSQCKAAAIEATRLPLSNIRKKSADLAASKVLRLYRKSLRLRPWSAFQLNGQLYGLTLAAP